jgi:hypothetical protein
MANLHVAARKDLCVSQEPLKGGACRREENTYKSTAQDIHKQYQNNPRSPGPTVIRQETIIGPPFEGTTAQIQEFRQLKGSTDAILHIAGILKRCQ